MAIDFKNLSKETQLLFLLSRVKPDESALEKAALISPTFNWDTFTSLSIKHGTSAIIYKNLFKLNDISVFQIIDIQLNPIGICS